MGYTCCFFLSLGRGAEFPFAAEGEGGLSMFVPILQPLHHVSYSGDTHGSGLWPCQSHSSHFSALPTPTCLTGLDGWLPA